ncbi:MAG: hypothetical protein ABIR31_11210 [Ginsengibacter sp.]
MENHLKIVNGHLKFQKVSLIEPSTNFYLLISAEIDYSILPFFLLTSSKKKAIIELAKKWCKELGNNKDVISAVVFKAIIIPPGKGKFIEERTEIVHKAMFDFAILIEAKTLEAIESIKNSNDYSAIVKQIIDASTFTHIISATNIKCISPVNHNNKGVFLFNYFFADSTEQNLEVWEYTAGWFQQETGLDNSTVLLPLYKQQSKFTIINHCRWDKLSDILPALLFKKSFHTYVLENFYANKVAAMPILYKIA